jgi:Family of unknown function (DUF5677)
VAKGKRKSSRQTRYSSLESHRREGKSFVPPFMQYPNTVLLSWRDSRIPEILWAVLLSGVLERDRYLDIFRGVIRRAAEAKQVQSLSHSLLAADRPEAFDYVFEPVFHDERASRVLSCLLLLRGLPDRFHWERHALSPDPKFDWHVLAQAIALATDHQSQEATDCRWLRVLHEVSRGRMHVNPEFEQELVQYPNLGDMRAVRPMIRSSEGAIDQLSSGSPQRAWPEEFWTECWKHTSCTLAHRRDEPRIETTDAANELSAVYGEVVRHFRRTLKTTCIDARHDSVFGMVLYGIGLAYSTCIGTAHHRIEGRMAIRSMAESLITLSFLLRRDQPGLWDKYRRYGSGQTKLAYLKSFDLDDPNLPTYVNISELEAMANEDAWLEFVTIDVGNWAGIDLRRMSEEINAKAIYDKYFALPSGYVHGHWGAVRDTIFGICFNPLYRFHRIPIAPRVTMASVAPAALKLTNLLLDALNNAYPPFKHRIGSFPEDAASEVSVSGMDEGGLTLETGESEGKPNC